VALISLKDGHCIIHFFRLFRARVRERDNREGTTVGEWWENFFDEAWPKAGLRIIRRKRTLADMRFILKALAPARRARKQDGRTAGSPERS